MGRVARATDLTSNWRSCRQKRRGTKGGEFLQEVADTGVELMGGAGSQHGWVTVPHKCWGLSFNATLL